MKVEILPSALEDLAEGFSYYQIKEEGLGEYFLDALYSDMDSLHFYGGIHSQHFGYHRLLAKRFPFAIYYRVDSDTAVVRAILDCRKDPSWIKKQLR